MEEQRQQAEPSSDQGVILSEGQVLSGKSLGRVGSKEYQDNYRKLSEEEKVLEVATQIVLNTIEKNGLISLADQELLLERTKRQVAAERQALFVVLNEALEELKKLKWFHLVPMSLSQMSSQKVVGHRTQTTLTSMKGGFRGAFIITFGNFVMAKNDGWMYRPTQHQMRNDICRFPKKRGCEQVANRWRDHLRGDTKKEKEFMANSSDEDKMKYESEELKEFKVDLENQIKELRETI